MTQTKEKLKLKPLGNRVIVKRLEEESTLKGGIILPESAKKKQETAIVVAIGRGKTGKDGEVIAPSVKVNDIVFMDKYSGQEVTVDDQEYVIVNADDIIAIVEQ